MKGRRVGELGNFKGTEYIARDFKRLGLKPAGDSGTYFQNLPFGPIGFDSSTSRLVAGGVTLNAKADWVPVAPSAANGLGGKADLSDAQTVFAGRWADTVPLDAAIVRGKVAVFVATPAAAGLTGGRGSAPVIRCD